MAIFVEYEKADGTIQKLFLKKSGHLFYFSPSKDGALDEVPEGYKIKYGKNGFPIVKKV